MTVHLHGGKKDSDLLFVMPRDLGPLLDAILPLDCKDCLCVFVLPCAGPKRERLLGLPSPLSPKEGDTLLLDLRPPPAIRIPLLMAQYTPAATMDPANGVFWASCVCNALQLRKRL